MSDGSFDRFGQKGDLVFENVEKSGTDHEGLRRAIGQSQVELAGEEGRDERSVIDQNTETPRPAGRDDGADRPVEGDPLGGDDREMKSFFRHSPL